MTSRSRIRPAAVVTCRPPESRDSAHALVATSAPTASTATRASSTVRPAAVRAWAGPGTGASRLGVVLHATQIILPHDAAGRLAPWHGKAAGESGRTPMTLPAGADPWHGFGLLVNLGEPLAPDTRVS